MVVSVRLSDWFKGLLFEAEFKPIEMGSLPDAVTWYKFTYAGEQVAQWDFQNNATRTSSRGRAFALEVPLRNLLTNISDFVPCDRIVQRAHFDEIEMKLRKGQFTWREGAPANRVTRLEELKHSPPLHTTHLTGTVSWLRGLFFERPLSATNITAEQGNFFPSYFSFLHGHGPFLCLRLVYYIDLFRLTVILFGR